MKPRHRNRTVMAISEQELTAMTDDLDQLHHDVGMPAMRAAVDRWTGEIRTSRRGFPIGAGAAAAGVALAACSSSPSTSGTTTTMGSGTSSSATLTGDLAVAALAASLENLAVAAYGDVLTAASAGKLGTVPPAVSAVRARSSIQVAASIQPVEMQHAAILHFVLGQYPVPDAFSPLTAARPLSDYRG